MMEKAELPVDTACEPVEEARQSVEGHDVISVSSRANSRLNFTNDTKENNSQSLTQSSIYKDILSQPVGLSHRERLLWLQKRRTEGLWAQCDECNLWRYLPHVLDRYELPHKWYCNMNPDKNLASCSAPEDPIHLRDEEDLIHSRFGAGSVVWARLPGWPWWPAMVDDCPDTEQFYWLDGFSDIPTHYNVAFFDKNDVTRAWIASENIVSYSNSKKLADRGLQTKAFRKRLITAIRQADDAAKLPLSSRLAKYSFIARYKGNILTPAKITKADIEKYRRHLKRKFNVELPSDSSDSDTDNSPVKNHEPKSIEGTPKKQNAKAMKPKKIFKKAKTPNRANELKKDNIVPDNNNTENAEVNKTLQESNSMAVHVDSAPDTVIGSFDNDTSKTYLPESLNSNISEPESQYPHGGGASPASGDFDFIED
ncbi:unnamed protein product [Parnassius apollo]|uniref:(apollo) hypothetical protein n=1 Tax=Parnassius apollo TaxID=110799 RepID=A0A8S3XKL0_PARAO|nr:unnamed protein product [Parnassius apollo]